MQKQKSVSKRINRTSAITYFAIVVLFVALKILRHYGCLDFLGKSMGIVLPIVIQIGLLFSLSMCVMCFSTKQSPLEIFRFYGFKKISWKGVLIAIVMGVIIYVLNVYFSTFLNYFLSLIGYTVEGEPSTTYPIGMLFLNLFLSAVLPAVCEETSHRGMLLNGISSTKKRTTAIIFTAVLFGLLHGNIYQCIYAIAIGLFFGYISSVMENIYPVIIMHFMNNALSIFMGYSDFHSLGVETILNYPFTLMNNNAVLGVMFLIALIVFLVMLLKLLMGQLFKHTILKQLHGLNDKVLKTMERDDYFQDLSTIVKSGEIYRLSELQDYARFKTLFYAYGKEFGFTSKLKNVVGEEEPVKRDKVATAFYVTSTVILGAVVVLEFVLKIIGII
ncbi:MAG: CPBP family intramembrane metalloprotease [Clostridia bacterium]|nr:CPBP family intramembrane metalloprotease [Clostridia bacterium]